MLMPKPCSGDFNCGVSYLCLKNLFTNKPAILDVTNQAQHVFTGKSTNKINNVEKYLAINLP